MRPMAKTGGLVLASLMLAAAARAAAADGRWVELSGTLGPGVWRQPTGAWYVAGDAKLNPENDRRLIGMPGTGVMINGPIGRTINLVTRRQFGDVELHCEFLVPRGSNSGVKFEGVYEIQISDSYGVKTLTGSDCGGVYPRAALTPRYHHIDDGIAPRVNACKASGEWQTLDAIFRAPRFDADGKKVANARIEKATLNGQVIHEDLELKTSTGNNWNRPEHPRGPILLQADHGPVAFRAVRVRPLGGTGE